MSAPVWSRHAALHERVRAELPLVLLTGPGGAGKSEALASVAGLLEAAQRPVLALCGRRLESSEPLAPLVDALGEVDPDVTPAELRAELARAASEGGVVLVDDAQWIDGATLRVLTGLAERAENHGVGMVVAQRPGASAEPDPAAALASALTGGGPPVELGPLSRAELTERASLLLDAPADDGLVDALAQCTGGLAHLADAVVRDWSAAGALARGRLADPDADPPAVARDTSAAVLARAAHLSGGARSVLRAQALVGTPDDELLAAVAGLATGELAALLEELWLEGVAGRDGRIPPAVAEVVVRDTPEGERRRLHRVMAEAAAAGRGGRRAAEHLREAGAAGAEAAARYLEAGDAAQDPAEALGWFERARDAGAPEETTAPRLARVLLISGRREEALPLADGVIGSAQGGDRELAVAVLAAGAAASGHWPRAARLYRELGDGGLPRAAAALASLLDGRVSDARSLVSADVPAVEDAAAGALGRSVRSLLAALEGDLPAARELAREGAAMLESARPVALLPDSPHALGAAVELLAGDPAAAADLCARALEAGVGGELARSRHRVLLGWARLRTGRLDEARELAATEGVAPRDRVLVLGLQAGLARRRTDLAAMEEVWDRAEPTLLAAIPDLLTLEPLGELVLCGDRLDPRGRAPTLLEAVRAVVDRAGSPAIWVAHSAWIDAALAVQRGDAALVERHSGALSRLVAEAPVPTPAMVACDSAAGAWERVLRGEIDAAGLHEVVGRLEAAGMAWEAGQLTGQAAIRVEDAGAARELLGRARRLRTGATVRDAEGGDDPLSEREREVAQLVAEGLTHKEIGAQLFISPKTVEHHVARIRQKLGVSTRAEMLAALGAGPQR